MALAAAPDDVLVVVAATAPPPPPTPEVEATADDVSSSSAAHAPSALAITNGAISHSRDILNTVYTDLGLSEQEGQNENSAATDLGGRSPPKRYGDHLHCVCQLTGHVIPVT